MINLKQEVERAIRSEWRSFTVNHPHLAAVIDEELLIEHAAASLRDDPEYQQTMQTAAAANVGAEVLHDLIVRLVGEFLRRLI